MVPGSWEWLVLGGLLALLGLAVLFWGRGCLQDRLAERLISVVLLAVWLNFSLWASVAYGHIMDLVLMLSLPALALLILFEAARMKRWGFDLNGLGLVMLGAAVCILVFLATRLVGL